LSPSLRSTIRDSFKVYELIFALSHEQSRLLPVFSDICRHFYVLEKRA
jgi:hypothetical protein